MATYIAGPMSGLPEFNHPAFAAKAAELRAAGVDVINPAEFDAEIGLDQPWAVYLRRDLVLLAERCDAVVLLPGWERSKGARLEHHVATELEMTITYPDPWAVSPFDAVAVSA